MMILTIGIDYGGKMLKQYKTGIYVDDTNQMVLFDTNELPLLVNPRKYTNSTSKKIKREIVRNWIARYVK